MKLPAYVKESSKIVGCFSYINHDDVFCDGDACIIAGSEELMKTYLRKLSSCCFDRNIIKKTRFGEIINGIKLGGAYAFDQESYSRFLPIAQINGIDDLPGIDWFLDKTKMELNFIRIQFVGL